jgi:hypothetical protein
MRVIIPPMSEPKASGINSSEGERSARRAACIATGRKIASAPTFFISAESTVTPAVRTPTMRSRERISGAATWRARSTIPDLPIAALTTSTEAMSGSSGLPNPENAFCCGTTPAATAASSANSATTS